MGEAPHFPLRVNSPTSPSFKQEDKARGLPLRVASR